MTQPAATGNILVTGSLAYDYIMDFPGHFKDHILPDKLHCINISFLVDKLKKQRGGCAANIAYTMKLLGAWNWWLPAPLARVLPRASFIEVST